MQAVTNIKEYLSLQNKWAKHRENLKIGDIVIFEENHIEQLKWPWALVIKLFYGKHGVVRSVQLKTKTSKLQRLVAKLYVLEGKIY